MFTAIRFTILILTLGGILYPLAMTGLGQVLFPHQANGSLTRLSSGQVVGSELLGQAFAKPEYFHPRPAVNGYDASNSGGSNLGATSKKLIERLSQDAAAYQKENQRNQAIPVDAVTASASNLDPHISLANALAQAPRVAAARHLSVAEVQQLISRHQEYPPLAEAPYVNVLILNLALDKQGALQRHG
ncbi:MAG TPA: potassium-transporting ATPase subunit KdpC [Coleofasciculaceae cyanobacterium]|jgi:K+-transporting ATPase ATPase C chain